MWNDIREVMRERLCGCRFGYGYMLVMRYDDFPQKESIPEIATRRKLWEGDHDP